MVLGAPEQHRALAVAQGEQRALLPVHELLDHDARAGRAEPPAQHALDLGFGVTAIRADGHALAGGQAIGLDDVGRLEPVQRRLGLGHGLVHAIAGGRYAVPLQQALGKSLGGLELRRLCGGAEARDSRRRQTVRQTGRQRDLRPHHDQISLDLARQGGEALGVVGLQLGPNLAQAGDARITGRGHQARQQRRLRDLPGQGVFASAGSDKQDVHDQPQ